MRDFGMSSGWSSAQVEREGCEMPEPSSRAVGTGSPDGHTVVAPGSERAIQLRLPGQARRTVSRGWLFCLGGSDICLVRGQNY